MTETTTHHAKDENRISTRERRYIARRHWIDSVKVLSGCVDCGIWGPPEVLTFDHIRGEKKFGVGTSWNQGRVALEEEMDKCEIVCANCHAIRTKSRFKDEPIFTPFPKIPRLKRDIVITEKINGTNSTVWIDGEGDVWAGSKNRWVTPEDDNYGFARWVAQHTQEFSEMGPCLLHGEWWGQGIQCGYGLTEKRFSLFNVGRWEGKALPECVSLVPVLYQGPFGDDPIRAALSFLTAYGSVASPGFMNPEGIVIFHTASGMLFKQTIKNDEKPKGSKE